MISPSVLQIYVVEYSVSQKQFCWGTIGRMIESNQRMMCRDSPGDYKPVFITDSINDVDTFIQKVQAILEAKPAPVNPLAGYAELGDMTFDQLMKKLNG